MKTTTIDQLLARTKNPEWGTADGRVRTEVLKTLAEIASRRPSTTVLAGLILRARFERDPAEGRTMGAMAALSNFDLTGTNERCDTPQDVVADLIETGYVVEVGAKSPLDSLIDGDSPYTRPRYRLVQPEELADV